MLNTILEYRKGILFVRLDGVLKKNTIGSISDKLISIINEDNLDKIVINVDNLMEIDFKGISFIFYLYETIKKNNGNILICGMSDIIKNKLKKNRILNYIREINNELEAFDLINI